MTHSEGLVIAGAEQSGTAGSGSLYDLEGIDDTYMASKLSHRL